MRGLGGTYQRGKRWWIRYSVRGHEYREGAGAEQKDAERLLKHRLKQIHAERFVGPERERLTVADLMRDYVAGLERDGAKAVKQARSHAKAVCTAFGVCRVVDLSARRVEPWIDQAVAEGRARGTIRTDLAFLRAALNRAWKAGVLATVPYIPTLSVSNARQGFFERHEHEAVLSHLPPQLQDVAQFAYLTGWRRGEILGLRWEYVDRSHAVIRLPDTKNGEGRVIPLEGDLGELVERRWQERIVKDRLAEYVFHRAGRRIVDFREAWRTACERAGVGHKLLHDYRRTACRDGVEAGNDPIAVMAMTGHRSLQVFQRYRIVDVRTLKRTMARMQEHRATLEQKVVRL